MKGWGQGGSGRHTIKARQKVCMASQSHFTQAGLLALSPSCMPFQASKEPPINSQCHVGEPVLKPAEQPCQQLDNANQSILDS